MTENFVGGKLKQKKVYLETYRFRHFSSTYFFFLGKKKRKKNQKLKRRNRY